MTTATDDGDYDSEITSIVTPTTYHESSSSSSMTTDDHDDDDGGDGYEPTSMTEMSSSDYVVPTTSVGDYHP